MTNSFYVNEIFHIFNRSISHFKIFKYNNEFNRFITLLEYYNQDRDISYSHMIRYRKKFSEVGLMRSQDGQLVKIIGYCIMPDHYHLIIKPYVDSNQVIDYISRVENAYAKYFNTKTSRHGHLWSGSFKSVQVFSNEQLLNLTKYVHRNPVKAGLVSDVCQWSYSSIHNYMNKQNIHELSELSINSVERYMKFVRNDKDYDKKLIDLDINGILLDI